MNMRTDLIEKALHTKATEGLTFRRLKPSNKFISWLFRHYFVREFSEYFYDSEPDYDDEEYNMYMDFLYAHKDFRYSNNPHTIEELKSAYKNILKQREEYEERRLVFNNWIEPYFAGNWDITQDSVDKFAREIMKSIKRAPVSYNGRLFIAEKDDYIYIYYFGRDYKEVDYWWVMKRK